MMKDNFVVINDMFLIYDLLARCPGGGKAQGLLDVLSDGHGAQDVEEDETAIGHVVTEEVPVAQALHPVDRGERELRDHSSIENRVEH